MPTGIRNRLCPLAATALAAACCKLAAAARARFRQAPSLLRSLASRHGAAALTLARLGLANPTNFDC